jgi:hypothetical protein
MSPCASATRRVCIRGTSRLVIGQWFATLRTEFRIRRVRFTAVSTLASRKVFLEFGGIDADANNKPPLTVLLESAANCTQSILEVGIVGHIGIRVGVELTDVELAKGLSFQRSQAGFDLAAQFLVLFACDRLPQFRTRARIVGIYESVIVDGGKQLVDCWGQRRIHIAERQKEVASARRDSGNEESTAGGNEEEEDRLGLRMSEQPQVRDTARRMIVIDSRANDHQSFLCCRLPHRSLPVDACSPPRDVCRTVLDTANREQEWVVKRPFQQWYEFSATSRLLGQQFPHPFLGRRIIQ